MPTEGVKTLRFAARINSIQYSTILGLVTAGGVVRAEYISGSEDKISGNWVYNFLILEEDIPSGLTFDAITESIFVAPYTQVWATEPDCEEYCYPITATETITDLPDYVTGLDVGAEVDGVTQVCEVKITMAEFATLITQILDLDFLATYICAICDCGGGGAAVPISYTGIYANNNSTSTAIAAATWGIVTEPWVGVMPEQDSTGDTVTGLLTVGTTGDYRFNVDLTITGTAGNTYSFQLYINGLASGFRGDATVGDLERHAVCIGGIVDLVAGDEVALYVSSDGGIDSVVVRNGQMAINYIGNSGAVPG